MSVTVTSIDIRREDFRSAVTGSDYLLGNLFQKFTAYIDYSVTTYINPKSLQELKFGDSNFNTLDYVTDNAGAGRFKEFFVGDNIVISGATPSSLNGTYQILAKVSNNTVQLDTTFTADTLMTAGTFLVSDKPKGCRFFFGMPENNEAPTFTSKIDGLEQQYKYGHATAIPSSYTDMTPLFKKSWQIGGCEVKRVAEDTTNHIYTFQVKHSFFISPFYLDTQLNDLLNSKAPSYFDKQKCLKYIFKIQSHYDVDDPNIFQEATIDLKQGNTGWLDENLNGGQTNYSVSGLAYERVSDSLSLTSIENVIGSSDQTKITFGIYNYTDTPFRIAGNVTKVNCSIIVLPENPATYQDVNSYMADNYCFDRAVATAAASPTGVNGDEYGTSYQIITDFKATYVLSQEIQCELTIDLGADVISQIGTLTDKKFLLVVQTEDLDTGVESNDAVTLKVDVNSFITTVPDLLTLSNGFVEHPENDIAETSTSFTALSNDEIVSNTSLLLETSAYNPLLNALSVYLIAKKTDGTEAILQQQDLNLSSVPQLNTSPVVQNPNITIPAPYNVASTEIRKNILFYRDSSIDSGTQKGFRLIYPFVFRWEHWKELILSGALPSDFFDTSQDYDGYNHDWNRLGDLTDWSIALRIETELSTDQGFQTETTDYDIPHRTFDENSDWTVTTKAYDTSGTELNNGTNPYVQGDIDTEIRSVFTKVAGSPAQPLLSKMTCMMRVLAYENGDFIQSYTYSSAYNRDSISTNWWKSLNADGLVELTKSGAVYTAKAKLDKSKLPNNYTRLVVISRIYEEDVAVACSFGLLTGTLSGDDSVTNAGFAGLTKEQFLFWVDGVDITTKSASAVNGNDFDFGFKAWGDYRAICSNDAVTGTTEPTNSINIGTGFSFESMIMIVDGIEQTTKVGAAYSSPNFTTTYVVQGDWKAFTPTSLINSDSMAGGTTFTMNTGYALNDILIFVDGILMNDKLASYDSGTGLITFGYAVAGYIKVYEI